jgi:hypothetical protein
MSFNYSMKPFFIILFLALVSNSYAQNAKVKKSFAAHFKVLDSIALITQIDTVYAVQSIQSVHFMEKNTKIYSSTNGNFYGRLGYTKENLGRWHEWYKNKYIDGKQKY